MRVPRVACTAQPCRRANTSTPRRWSECSCVSRIALTLLASSPASVMRRATSRAENPQSMRTVVAPSVTATALPPEPEPRNTTRSWLVSDMRAVYTAAVTASAASRPSASGMFASLRANRGHIREYTPQEHRRDSPCRARMHRGDSAHHPDQGVVMAVHLYALSTCPYCRMTKKYLDEHEVAYEITEVDLLEGDDEGRGDRRGRSPLRRQVVPRARRRRRRWSSASTRAAWPRSSACRRARMAADKPARRVFHPGTTIDDLKAYMGPFAERLGYKFNTETDFVDEVLQSELEILDRDGDVYCPCRVRTGDPKEDAQIVCPCIPFYRDEFAAIRKCWCGLFILAGRRGRRRPHRRARRGRARDARRRSGRAVRGPRARHPAAREDRQARHRRHPRGRRGVRAVEPVPPRVRPARRGLRRRLLR